MFIHDHARKGLAEWNYFLCVITIVLSPTLASAQGICPIKTVKVDKLIGQVVENTKARTPWTNVLVELRSSRGSEPIISTARTDENGSFGFVPPGKGTYFLDVATQHFPSYRLVIKYRGLSRDTKGGGFFIRLDPDCGKTEVLLGK